MWIWPCLVGVPRVPQKVFRAVKALESGLGNHVFPEDEIMKGKAVRPERKRKKD